jgi:tetratricopeptide (TPR) repeat protein
MLLAMLSVLAVMFFLLVTGLSHLYQAQQESLGERWFSRGVADLNAQKFDSAVLEFRTALRYSRDNYSYQLSLAEALIGLKRTGEAHAYLINLWERQPENGLVNLALARIAAQSAETEQALRYYHNAIYATWPDGEVRRREVRVELIEYLLKINANEQADAESIALEANLGDDPAEQARVGGLFMRAQDYEHALAAYRESLKSGRRNPTATAGAGMAAFELGRYPLAYRYLQAAVNADPHDTQSARLLKTTELVLQMDPFQRQLSAAHRNRIVVEAFAAAGERLKSCGVKASAAAGPQSSSHAAGTKTSAASPAATAPSRSNLADTWAQMKPRTSQRRLERDPDWVESAMDLAFDIERETAATCGAPGGTDQALLLISKLHEGR